MTIALRHWNRDTLLARLRAREAIDRAVERDTAAAARLRLRLLSIGDQYEAAALPDADTIAVLDDIARQADAIPEAAVIDTAAGVGSVHARTGD